MNLNPHQYQVIMGLCTRIVDQGSLSTEASELLSVLLEANRSNVKIEETHRKFLIVDKDPDGFLLQMGIFTTETRNEATKAARARWGTTQPFFLVLEIKPGVFDWDMHFQWVNEPDRSKPPCLECGAMTAKEAETACICNGDKDDCHGQELWPD